MTITPPDAPIAKHSICAAVNSLSEDIHLLLFFNGCRPSLQAEVLADVPSSPFVSHKSNWDSLIISANEVRNQIGVNVKSDICFEMREGFYETCGEVWSRELIALTDYDYVGILDADLEVLDKTLLADMVNILNLSMTAALVSTDFGPSQFVYEPYSGEHCYLMQRYHTWCCLYRLSALNVFSSFSYYEDRSEAVVRKYDHSSFLQHELKRRGYTAIALGHQHSWRFLHYGQFAKNKSLNGSLLWIYRLIRIARHNGFYHINRSRLLSRVCSRLGGLLYTLFRLHRYDRERLQYISLEEADRLGYLPHPHG